jgi:photosystem II stability/assembly factor-like uncharacterized protein
MSRSSGRGSSRLGLVVRLTTTSVVLAFAASGCVASISTSSSVKQPALPASARMVRTAEMTFPPVALPPSKKPNGGQRSVVFVDRSTGFLASGGQPMGSDQGGTYLADMGGIERTADGGDTWTMAWGAPGAFVNWVGFQSHAIGFAAGTQFDTSSSTSSPGQPLWLRSSDSGATWTALTPRIPASVTADWGSMQFMFATSMTGIGVRDPNVQMPDDGAAMIRTTDGGQDWSQVGLHGWIPTGGAAFLTPGAGFATGYGTIPADSSRVGQLWTSADAGQSWHAVAGTQVPFLLFAVDFPDRLHGFAAGGNYEKYEARPWRGLLATTDGGRTWSVRYQSPDADRSNPITRLHFVDSNRGWAAIGGCTEGQNGPCGGAVMLTSDSGRSWRMTGQTAVPLSPISPTEAWVIDSPLLGAGILWHTVDGGGSWEGVVRPGALGIDSLVGSQEWLVAHTAAGAWSSVDGGQTWLPFNAPILGLGSLASRGSPQILVESPGLVMVADGPALRVSHDGGQNWTAVTLPVDATTNNGVAVAFSDSQHGMAITGNQVCVKPQPGVPQGSVAVLTTADGGLTWKEETSLPRYTAAISATKGLAVITGSAGCGPTQQSIAVSRDDGGHWATQTLPFGCLSVSVARPATIWLTCQTDQTFLLVSLDGGQTWTKDQSRGTGAAFLATGPSEGWAYGPAGALWHTKDAGRHWTAWVPGF